MPSLFWLGNPDNIEDQYGLIAVNPDGTIVYDETCCCIVNPVYPNCCSLSGVTLSFSDAPEMNCTVPLSPVGVGDGYACQWAGTFTGAHDIQIDVTITGVNIATGEAPCCVVPSWVLNVTLTNYDYFPDGPCEWQLFDFDRSQSCPTIGPTMLPPYVCIESLIDLGVITATIA